MTYRSEGKPAKTRKIEPLEVVLFQSSLYTVAAANEIEDENSRIRVWKLDRFDKATLLDEWFKPPEDFEPEAFFGNSQSIFRAQESPATYKIWLAPKAVIWVTEDPWHPEQVLKENKDGSATLTVVAAHPKDVLPKVLEFGEHAELLSPAKRRKELAKEIATMAKRYK